MLQMTEKKLVQLASQARQEVIKMLLAAGSGHSAGSLGAAEILVALYFQILNIDPQKPHWPERDRFVLSNAHICPILYAVLALRGFFNKKELSTLRQLGSRLQGHSTFRHGLPGVETSGGPLGQGLSQAVGMALARQLDRKKYWLYCLLSDGELDEGQVWEAALLAAKYRLWWLTAIIDRNNIQIEGQTENVLPLEPLAEKWRSFGWHVQEIDGHNFSEIKEACQKAKAITTQPSVIIARTIPGKGVDFMEYRYQWHGLPPNRQQAALALCELRTLGGRIVNENE